MKWFKWWFLRKIIPNKNVIRKKHKFRSNDSTNPIKAFRILERYLKCKKALLILKWRESIKHWGKEQVKILGNSFLIQIYLSSLDSRILRLDSPYRHDLKCYSTEEGKCLKNIVSFLKGLLQFQLLLLLLLC